MIYQALQGCEDISQFTSNCEKYYKQGMVEEIFETPQNEPFNPLFLGCQGDLEWIYTVDLDKKQVKVFGGGYSGALPQVAYSKGPVNPLNYVEYLYEEYQEQERDSIQKSIDSIKTLGYSINK